MSSLAVTSLREGAAHSFSPTLLLAPVPGQVCGGRWPPLPSAALRSCRSVLTRRGGVLLGERLHGLVWERSPEGGSCSQLPGASRGGGRSSSRSPPPEVNQLTEKRKRSVSWRSGSVRTLRQRAGPGGALLAVMGA